MIPIISGFFTGLVWWSIINGYIIGLEFHKAYTEINNGIFNIIKSILKGLFVDAVAPWYAIFFKTNGYDEIRKDDPKKYLEYETNPIILTGSPTEVYEYKF